MPKTAHQLARELLALPDLPVYHYDPSFVDSNDEESDHSIGTPTAAVEDPKEGLTAEEVENLKDNGFTMEPFISISGDQPEEYDRGAEPEEIP